jgi:hypothetical protein
MQFAQALHIVFIVRNEVKKFTQHILKLLVLLLFLSSGDA